MRTVLGHLYRNKESRAHWIDTTGDFSVDRALKVLESVASCRHPDDLPSQQRTHVFDRLTVSRCFDVRTASQAITAMAANREGARFLVVDSMTSLFAEHLTDKSAQGYASMVAFVRRLSALAKSAEAPMTVLVRFLRLRFVSVTLTLPLGSSRIVPSPLRPTILSRRSQPRLQSRVSGSLRSSARRRSGSRRVVMYSGRQPTLNLRLAS